MIARSRLVFSSVLLASSALHLGAVTLIWSEPAVEMEGGAPAAQSSSGSSFADLAAGVQQPINAVSEVSHSVRPATTSPINPTVQATPAPPPVLAPQPVAPSEASIKPLTTPSPAPDTAVAPTPPARPVQADTQPVTPETTAVALPDTSAATPVSVRPKMPVSRPDHPPKAKPALHPAKPRGNAARNAKAGMQTLNSAKPSQPVQSSKAATRKAQGNAAASNYAGLVMARISRVPRPRTSARGIAVIQFSIAANGGLASVGIAHSSGSGALDRAALAVVQKAQPFPRPPSGARRSYSIKIKGR